MAGADQLQFSSDLRCDDASGAKLIATGAARDRAEWQDGVSALVVHQVEQRLVGVDFGEHVGREAAALEGFVDAGPESTRHRVEIQRQSGNSTQIDCRSGYRLPIHRTDQVQILPAQNLGPGRRQRMGVGDDAEVDDIVIHQ